MEDPGAAGLGEELGAKADQPARGDQVLEPDPAGRVVDHLLHPPLAQGEHLGDDADVLLGNVDRQPLDRLAELAVDLAGQHLRLAGGQLEALAPHHLEQHDELQLAAPLHLPGVGALGVAGRGSRRCRRAPGRGGRGSGARSAWRPRWPASGELLIPMTIESEGSSTVITGSGRGSSGSASVSPIVTSGEAGDGDDLARPGLVGLDPVERVGDVEVGDGRRLDRAVGPAPGDRLALRGSSRCAPGRAPGGRRRGRRRGW